MPKYTTIAEQVAKGGVKASKARQNTAKMKATQLENQQQRLQREYGSAMGSTIRQAFKPATAIAGATLTDTRSRVLQAKQGVKTGQVSNSLYTDQQAAMFQSNKELQKTTVKEGMPQLISARSAMAEANKYVQMVGMDMKKMDWTARAAIAQTVLDQNGEALRMQLASQLELQSQQALMDLQQQAIEDQQLAGAPAVVSTVQNAIPAMVSKLQEGLALKDTEGFNAVTYASEWASSAALDPAAQGLLADMLVNALNGAEAHIVDGTLDQGYLQGVVNNSILSAYPSYTGSAQTVSTALNLPSINGALNGTMSEEQRREAALNSGGFGDEYMYYMQQRAADGGGIASGLLALGDSLFN